MNKKYKQSSINFLFTLLMVLLSVMSFSATYYISNSGNDSNSGLTTTAAWQSLTKVNASIFKPGDQILFKKGDSWYGSITIKQSGTAGNPITFGAYGTGANPIITGFTTVTGWTNLGNNIWESTNAVSTLSKCNMVVINGIATAMGRWPNADTSNSGYAVVATNPTTTSFTSASLTGTPDWTGAEVVFRLSYLIKRKTVVSQIGNTINYDISGSAPAGGGFFIQNSPIALDKQNEWYFNPTSKKILVYSVSQPIDVKVSSSDYNILLNGANMGYITFDGLQLQGSSGISIGRSGAGAGDSINIRNCDILYSGTYGLPAQANNSVIENNTITDSNVTGLWVSSFNNIVIRNNTITNTGILRGMGLAYNGSNSAIQLTNSDYILCENNTVINTAYKGIGFYGNYITLKNNFIDTYGVWHDDGGAIYTYTGTGTPIIGCKIQGNIILNGIDSRNGTSNTEFPIIAAGIYCDYGTQNVEIFDNSIYNSKSYGIFLGNNENINIHNNTIVDDFDIGSTTINACVRINNNSELRSYNIDWNNNIFVSLSSSVLSMYINASSENIPLLADADNNWYLNTSDATTTFKVNQPNTSSSKTLSDWRSFSGQDLNSKISPQLFLSEKEMQFEYNASQSSKTISLSQAMIDIKGTKYASSVTLQPYTSVVLMKDNNPATVPGAPTSITATAGNTSASVSFVAPVNTGGSVITGYTVTSVPAGGIDENAGSTSLTHKISGLTNDISYIFTVTATNSAGNSVASVSSNSVIPFAENLITKQAEILPTHFIPVWQGENGLNHMNIMVVSAVLEDLPLNANDEIAVFDGAICVGSMKLSVPINSADNTTFLTIPASQNDGTNNGFNEQDSIIFKIWDDQNQTEMLVKTINYRQDIGSWNTSGKYAAGATSVVELVSFIEFSQSIELVKGYNLISTYVAPLNSDASIITQALCEAGSLVKIQDESGKSLEDWGSYGGWINQLGTIQNTEGYKIKVANNCILQVTGRPIALPLDIPLKTGWNIISFPRTDQIDALSVVQSLIDRNVLVKVQDELGNSVENWGIFGGWKNSIGFFIPGKAYKVKLSADAILTIQDNYIKSALILAKTEKTEYFSSGVVGNGTDHMNINVIGLSESGISAGDELAAFDGNNCVGTLKITENNLMDGSAALVTSFSSDEQNPDGFIEGHPIQLIHWNKQAGIETQVDLDVLNGQALYAKNSSVLIRLKSITTEVSIFDDRMKIDVFPNPCSGRFTVRFSNLPDAGSKLDILDISGRKILSRMITGMSEDFNLDHQSPGIYLVKSVINSKETIQKLIIN